MLFRNNYGVDLGSSSVKVYSFFRNKSYIEKNMVAYRGRRILAIGNEAYEMFEKSPADISVNSPMAFGMLANLIAGDRPLQHDKKNRSYIRSRSRHVFLRTT